MSPLKEFRRLDEIKYFLTNPTCFFFILNSYTFMIQLCCNVIIIYLQLEIVKFPSGENGEPVPLTVGQGL